jgi:HAD superfamily hydrolase (TIGR01549 family)
MTRTFTTSVFDLDGTLLDSDEALVAAFLTLGVPRQDVTFGHLLADECGRLGISVDDYLGAYDPSLVRPFPGVDELVGRLGRWAVCSNKVGASARAELARLGWEPDVALFAEEFLPSAKSLGPVLSALDVVAGDVLFVGDTDHDRRCARQAGVAFAWAGWNPRVVARAGDVVLRHPLDVLTLLG